MKYFAFYSEVSYSRMFRVGWNIFKVEKECRSATQCEWVVKDVYIGTKDSYEARFEHRDKLSSIFDTKREVIGEIFS